MQLNVKETATLLNVSEKTIYRWIKQNKIPAYRIHDQYRFNRMELMEWATAAKLQVAPQIYDEPDEQVMPSLSEALQAGGIFYRIEGRSKGSVITTVVEHMRLPDDTDRAFVLQALLAREELGSTGIGDGIAIPHIRNPLIMNLSRPCLTLCFLEHPVDFGAIDGQPVHTIFALVNPTVRTHLHLLARLAFALKDESVRDVLSRQGSREEIIGAFQLIEKTFQN